MFIAGLMIGVAMYKLAGYSNKDWTPIAIGFGFACVMPIVTLCVSAMLKREKVSEALVAFSIGQGTSMWATYGALAILSFFAIAGVVRIVT